MFHFNETFREKIHDLRSKSGHVGRWQRCVKHICKCSDCHRRFATEDAPCERHLYEWTCMHCFTRIQTGSGERCKPCQKMYKVTDVFNPFSITELYTRDGHAAVRVLKKLNGNNYRLEFDKDSVEWDKGDFQEEPDLKHFNADAQEKILHIYGGDKNAAWGTVTYGFKVKKDTTIKFWLQEVVTDYPVLNVDILMGRPF